ncbi:hypothetical protein IHQ71_31385 (plasmid) [Rhizobium sp. TH2]|uniref:DUF5906 domain-containing protein n=1 Tax=Rhizobium sp. TH2 TaxID=2775403 RepID=UPI002157F075|nr:DUF5906 domain-containing protein [Rhizobium sp. TH2]UVC12669.1 hypothetical protein IHQ71_31385 [Rhizobium sp. TH2]
MHLNYNESTKKLFALNENHILIKSNGKLKILDIETDPAGYHVFNFTTPHDFCTFYSNQKIPSERGLVKVGNAWMEWEGRNQKYGLDFDPNGAPDNIFNMYQPSKIAAIEGDCQLYLDHIFHVIAGGKPERYEFVLDFLADGVQNPGVRPGVAIVLRGQQGTGKGQFVHYYSQLFGPQFAHVVNSDQIFGRFNSMLMNKLLIFLDEATWGGDKEKEGKLKALVTEPTVIIERKGQEAFVQKNFARLIFASNNKWVIAAGDRERRFCVFDVSVCRRGDTEYFAAMAHQMKNGGLEALMHLLQNRDLTGVNIRNFPRTSALDEQVRRNFDAFHAWWNDCLTRGYILPPELDPHGHFDHWENAVPIELCHDSLVISAKKRLVKNHLSETELGIELRKVLPNVIVKKITLPKAPGSNGKTIRKNAYVLPPLDECRRYFDSLIGTETEWINAE